MAFRSVRMRVFNMTGTTLRHTDTSLDHGIITDPWFPPSVITPNQFGQWRAESDGIGTGTEGEVKYKFDGSGDSMSLSWDNPAVGNTFFQFTINGGGPSDFTWFGLHFASDESVEPPPGQMNPLFAVSQGDLDGSGLIVPVPWQEHIKPHAWFDIGVRNRKEPVSVRVWLQAIGEDPNSSLRTIFLGRPIKLRELIELPINH